MSIEFQCTDKDSYVLIRCRGSFEPFELIELWQDIFESVGAYRKPVLVDIRELSGATPTTMERYEIGARMAELQRGVGRGIPLACVGNEPIVDPERFAEVVGSNRGAYARAFTDIDEALIWIDEVAPASRRP